MSSQKVFIKLVDDVMLNVDDIIGYSIERGVTMFSYNDTIYTYNPSVDNPSVAADDVTEEESIQVRIAIKGSLILEQNVVGTTIITLVDTEAEQFIYRIENSELIDMIIV